jgi:hypothetical protein
MSETMEYINHLSNEIGPRPAGTEEERQAAEFIAEELETSSGLPTEIEDFTAPAGSDAPRAIVAGLAVIGGALSLLTPMFGIPAVILALIAAIITVADYLDKPLLFKVLSRGASQNVVAKYNPGVAAAVGRGRARKVIVVAHYDSGKVRNELSSGLIKLVPGLQRAAFWSVPVLFVVVLLRTLFLATDTGLLGVLSTVLTFIGVILSLVPLVFTLLHKISPFNEAANSNAAGVAVMMEVAGRVGRGRMTEEQIEHLRQYDEQDIDGEAEEFAPVVHDEQAAFDAGVVPEGAKISYEAESTANRSMLQAEDARTGAKPAEAEDDPVSGLLAAKAAIAAMTGVDIPATVALETVATPKEVVPAQVAPEEIAPVEAAPEIVEEVVEGVGVSNGGAVASAEEAESAPVEGFAMETAQKNAPAVPDWFASARAKAKANKPEAATAGTVKRSRYADALDAAVSESSVFFDSANQALTDMDQQISRLRDGIMEVKTPTFVAPDPTGVTKSFEPVGTTETPAESGEVAPVEVVPVEFEPAVAEAPATPKVETSPVETGLEAVSSEPVVVTSVAQPIVEQSPEEPAATPFVEVVEEPEPVEEIVEPVSDFVGGIADEFAADSISPSLSQKIPVISADKTDSFAAVTEGQGQRAPLADSSSTAKSLLSMLPSINPSDPAEAAVAANIASLRATLPSLSGTISAVKAPSPAPASTGSAGATGVFAPVTEEMVKAADSEEDLFIEDADDSDYQENFTETGAFAGPDYIEMPKSPVRNFFDKLFHRKDKDAEFIDDQSGWGDDGFEDVAYGDSYDGGWADEGQEFNDELEDFDGYIDEYEDEYADEFVDENGKWNGGGLSALKDAASSLGSKTSSAAQDVAGRVHHKSSQEESGEAPTTSRRGRFMSLVDEPVPFDDDPRARFEEQRKDAATTEPEVDIDEVEREEQLDRVKAFRNPFVDTEVWFVALGSDLACNAGMRAFIDAHSDELRGALVVELDGLGAGTLSMVESEGCIKTVLTSSRMKRYMRKVTQATGVPCSSVKFEWNDSASSYANAHGVKAMHLVGELGGKPAYFAQENDVIESIEEQTLEANVECVMELLRII